MKVEIVEIVEITDRYYSVRIDRLGKVGQIYSNCDRSYKFSYTESWMKLTYDENTAVLAAVEPKVTLLNITRRLTR